MCTWTHDGPIKQLRGRGLAGGLATGGHGQEATHRSASNHNGLGSPVDPNEKRHVTRLWRLAAGAAVGGVPMAGVMPVVVVVAGGVAVAAVAVGAVVLAAASTSLCRASAVEKMETRKGSGGDALPSALLTRSCHSATRSLSTHTAVTSSPRSLAAWVAVENVLAAVAAASVVMLGRDARAHAQSTTSQPTEFEALPYQGTITCLKYERSARRRQIVRVLGLSSSHLITTAPGAVLPAQLWRSSRARLAAALPQCA